MNGKVVYDFWSMKFISNMKIVRQKGQKQTTNILMTKHFSLPTLTHSKHLEFEGLARGVNWFGSNWNPNRTNLNYSVRLGF